MVGITFLGVGGALADHPADNHTALLVEASNANLLLDCGPTIMRQLERVNVDAGYPTHVYLSHQHGDHILGLPMLLLNRVLLFPDEPLTVLAMPDVLQKAQDLARLAYPELEKRFHGRVTFAPLELAEEQRPLPGAAGLRYRLAPAQHSAPTYALRLDWEDGVSLVYSSDTGPSPAIAQLAAGASLLVHDSFYLASHDDGSDGHSSAGQVGQIAAQAGVRAVALVHRMGAERRLARQYTAEALRFFRGKVFAPMAGDSVQL